LIKKREESVNVDREEAANGMLAENRYEVRGDSNEHAAKPHVSRRLQIEKDEILRGLPGYLILRCLYLGSKVIYCK
jgi:hypothetical protein